MRKLSLLAAPAVALAIGVFAGSAQAAPAGSALGGLKADPAATSPVEKTHWRRGCFWHRGHLHCRGDHYYHGGWWWGHRHHRWHHWRRW
jgi:hypothetical protein